MRRTEKPNGSDTLAEPVLNTDTNSAMPDAFGGMYQSGYDAGYAAGKEAGFCKGFKEGYAAAHAGPSGAAVTPSMDGASAPKRGPRRLLVGLPCANCGAYFDRNETHCTACRAPNRRTPVHAE